MSSGSFKLLTTPEQLADYLKDTTARIENHATLYHYTTVESLIKICQNKTWLLSNAIKMNDLVELNYGDRNQWAHLHYSCFSSEEKENVGMWSMYSQPWEKGVKLSFPAKAVYEWIKKTTQLLQFNPITMQKMNSIFTLEPSQLRLTAVAYSNYDSLQKGESEITRWSNQENNLLHQVVHQYSLTGYVKDQAWSYEKEFRIVAQLKEAHYPFRLALEIPDWLLAQLVVTTSPLFEGNLQDIMKKETGLTITTESSLFQNRFQKNSPCKNCEYKKEKVLG